MKKEITGKELLKRKSIHFTETLTIKKKNKSKKSIIKSSLRIIFGMKKKTFLKKRQSKKKTVQKTDHFDLLKEMKRLKML